MEKCQTNSKCMGECSLRRPVAVAKFIFQQNRNDLTWGLYRLLLLQHNIVRTTCIPDTDKDC